MLERLYDLDSGEIRLENNNIQALSVPWLRSRLGLVSQVGPLSSPPHHQRQTDNCQEPLLFDRTIAENIKYGNNSVEVTMQEVMEVARVANIHNMIISLPEQYETRVGERGVQLSGGQKQRIAIARALVSRPTLLLLDEATSALDPETKSVVQESIDTAMIGRTCLTVTHDLNAVQFFDMIYVIDKGKVAESGSHEELLEQQGECDANNPGQTESTDHCRSILEDVERSEPSQSD